MKAKLAVVVLVVMTMMAAACSQQASPDQASPDQATLDQAGEQSELQADPGAASNEAAAPEALADEGMPVSSGEPDDAPDPDNADPDDADPDEAEPDQAEPDQADGAREELVLLLGPPTNALVDPTLRFISYWSPSELKGRPPQFRYAMDSSNRAGDLQDAGGIRVDLPFGVPPANSGTIRVWSLNGGGASTADGPLYPIECLGFRPDVDGDALLDDCDPFPTDGPLADYDGDGVLNSADNCPVRPNPDQTTFGRSLSGAACTGPEGDPTRNYDRILFAELTIEDVNASRAADGLDPLAWPVVDPVLLPEVAEWCDLIYSSSLPATSPERVDQMVATMPSVYGFNDEDLAQFAADVKEMWRLYEEDPRDEANVQALDEIEARSHASYMVLGRSDQACDIGRR